MSIQTDPREYRTFEDSQVETMFYAKDKGLPWYGGEENKGVKELATAATLEEALEASGLNWEVETGDLFGRNGKALAGRQAVYRKTDDAVLGIVSPTYKPIQNRIAGEFMDSLVADEVMRYTTAGSLYGGSQIWIQAQMKEGWQIGNDPWVDFITFVNSHDGSSTAKVFLTKTRVVCRNTKRIALKEATKKVNIRHTGSISDKLEVAKEVFKITTETQRRYNEWLGQLQETKVTPKQVTKVAAATVGSLDGGYYTEEYRTEIISRFMAVYNQETERFGENAYSVYNAVTGYADHGLTQRRTTDKMAQWMTVGERVKNNGIKVLGEVIKNLEPVA